jgi:hypothetical protein
MENAAMSDPPDSYPNEDRRWMLVLGIPMLGACIFMATAIGTSINWLIAFCLAFGPGAGVVSLIYLAISSDTNGDSAPSGERWYWSDESWHQDECGPPRPSTPRRNKWIQAARLANRPLSRPEHIKDESMSRLSPLMVSCERRRESAEIDTLERATTVEIPSSHVAMVSHPREVAELIETAASAVGATAATH